MFTKILIITIEKRNGKILIVFDDMIADITTNKKFQAIFKEIFIKCIKFNVSLVFITQPYFLVPKDATLSSTRYLIMRSHDKKELQHIAINNSPDLDYKDFMMTHRK